MVHLNGTWEGSFQNAVGSRIALYTDMACHRQVQNISSYAKGSNSIEEPYRQDLHGLQRLRKFSPYQGLLSQLAIGG
jgi:hypothetical protein